MYAPAHTKSKQERGTERRREALKVPERARKKRACAHPQPTASGVEIDAEGRGQSHSAHASVRHRNPGCRNGLQPARRLSAALPTLPIFEPTAVTPRVLGVSQPRGRARHAGCHRDAGAGLERGKPNEDHQGADAGLRACRRMRGRAVGEYGSGARTPGAPERTQDMHRRGNGFVVKQTLGTLDALTVEGAPHAARMRRFAPHFQERGELYRRGLVHRALEQGTVDLGHPARRGSWRYCWRTPIRRRLGKPELFAPFIGAGVGVAQSRVGNNTMTLPATTTPGPGESRTGPAWTA